MENVLIALQQKAPQLRPSERRVAETIIATPALVLESTISQLAEHCNASPGTITRMCHALGFSGYKDFRLAIASTIGREQTSREFFQVSEAQIDPSDSAAEVIAKIAYQESRTIEETAKLIDPASLDAVANALKGAKRVDLFGAGSSGIAAQDLQLKLHRIGVPSFWWADTHLALTSIGITEPGGFALAISHTGTTLEAVQFLEIARRRGASTAAITNFPESPLAARADHVLTTWAHDDGMRVGAMPSRIAQMAVIDFLLVRLVQRDMAGTETLLRASFDAVKSHRVSH